MEADHPARRLRVKMAARGIAAEAVHPAREQRGWRAIRISTTGSGAPCLVFVARPRAPRAMTLSSDTSRPPLALAVGLLDVRHVVHVRVH
eukprot:3282414-Prymnesium_polylepis.1